MGAFEFEQGPPARTLTALSAARLWLGLKNSDDQGTAFDLHVVVAINDIEVAAGETRCVTGVTRNPDKAKEVTVPFDPIDDGTFAPGDELSLTIFARIGTNTDGSKCSGHSNAVGLRLYYDAMQRPAQFRAALAPEPLTTFYLRSTGGDVLDEVAPTTTKTTSKDAPGLNFKNGNPWKPIGTWSLKLP